VPQRFNSATNTPTGPNKSMQELYARLDVLQQQLDETQGKDRDDENSNIKHDLQQITKERDDLLQENSVIRAALSEKDSNGILDSRIGHLCSTKSAAASMSKQYQSQLDTMEEIIDELRLQLQAVLAQRRSRDAEESTTVSTILNEHESALLEAETYKQRVEVLQERLDAKDRHIAELEQKLKQLELST
jgi:chromosome segregation ATPase